MHWRFQHQHSYQIFTTSKISPPTRTLFGSGADVIFEFDDHHHGELVVEEELRKRRELLVPGMVYPEGTWGRLPSRCRRHRKVARSLHCPETLP